MRFPTFLVGMALATACSHPQRAYVFSEGSAPDRATRVLLEALASEGLQAATVDPGTIVTTWLDTGYRFHEEPPFNENAIDIERTVFRRYQIAVVRDGATGATSVRLQAETRRCTPEVTIRNERLVGDCKDVDPFFPDLQSDMDALGKKLRQAIELHTPETASQSLAQSHP